MSNTGGFCDICDDWSETLIPLKCRCKWCPGCIQRNFENARIEDGWPVKCCTILKFEDMKPHLAADLIQELETKIPIYSTPASQRVFCANTTCLAFIPVTDIQGDVATCSACTKKTCRKCKHTNHEGECPTDQALEQTLALSEQENWKRCKECGQLVEWSGGAKKSKGCAHLTCPCKNRFCAYCGESQWHCDRCLKKK